MSSLLARATTSPSRCGPRGVSASWGPAGAWTPPSADNSSTKLAEARRRFLIHPGQDSDKRRGAAEGLPYLARTANGKEKLECGEPAKGALSELSRSRAQNGRDGVRATLFNLTNSYAKQETNPEMIKMAKLAPHHTPKEHELDGEEFTDKQICTICQLAPPPH